jgi:hypothetical protein
MALANQGEHPVGAPKGSQNGLSHGIVAFKNQVKRRAHRGRSVIDRRSAAGKNAVAFQQELIVDQGGADNLSAAKLALIELIGRDTYFCDEIDRRIFHTMYKINQVNPNSKRYGVKGLATLYGYRNTIARNLASNLLALGLEKVPPRQKTLAEILSEDEEGEEQNGVEKP